MQLSLRNAAGGGGAARARASAHRAPLGTTSPRILQRPQPVRGRLLQARGAMEDLQKAMQANPEMAKQMEAMQEAMKRPEVQEQLAQMQAMQNNKNLQARLQELKGDPEFAGFFKELETGGMQALLKYSSDEAFLAKVASRIGDTLPAQGGAPPTMAPPGAAAPPAPEVKDLLDAAKFGDEEAVEDFLAIGKDAGMADAQLRTPLHYAAGYNHASIAKMLVDAGAPLEARDSMGNTPLLYAAGYGRAQLCDLLLSVGADKAAKNNNGKTAFDLAVADDRNPVSKDEATLTKLRL